MSGGEQSQRQSKTDATEAATVQSDFAVKLQEEMIHLTQGNRQCIWIPEGDMYSSEYQEELTTGINIWSLVAVREEDETKEVATTIRQVADNLEQNEQWHSAMGNGHIVLAPSPQAVEAAMTVWELSQPVTQEEPVTTPTYLETALVSMRWIPPVIDESNQWFNAETKDKMGDRDLRHIPLELGVSREQMHRFVQAKLAEPGGWKGMHVVRDSTGIQIRTKAQTG
eukprot:231008-Rhodomonas_salina.1